MHSGLIGTAASQGGVFTAAQALSSGYTRDEIRARLASGRWLRVRRGIYRAGGEVDERAVAAAAAVLACTSGTAVASHGTAAYLHGIPLLRPSSKVELTVPVDSLTTSVKGCAIHRAQMLGDSTTLRGVRVTTVPRTVVDLARDRDFAAAVVAADHCLRQGVTAADLAVTVHRMRGAPGQHKVRRAIDFADGRAESVGESLTRVVLAQQGLPTPLLAQPVHSGSRLLGVVDFLWPGHRTALEFDGQLKYSPENDRGPDALWQEKLREDALRRAGLEVVRVTWADVTRQPQEVAARVRQAFERAEARPTAS